MSVVRDQKEAKTMTNELHCSACDATVPADSQFCPGCGLPLTAHAVPAVYVEGPRFSLWKVLLIVGVVMFLVIEILGRK
jgi:predicted amidophosphoribosyltransferase